MMKTDFLMAIGLAAAALALPGFGKAAHKAAKAPQQPRLEHVMYVGDSITHGVNSASYRWAFHKILVDNGIDSTAVGYKTGNHSAGVQPGTAYAGKPFSNVHSAQASARAWELAGRKPGGRYDNTNLANWLGLSTTKTDGSTYPGETYQADTFVLLIGTNDLLSDDTAAGITPAKVEGLLGRKGTMQDIVETIYKANPHATLCIMTVPCWTRHSNSNGADVHAAAQKYNESLAAWVAKAAGKRDIRLVELNAGMVDVAEKTPFFGCDSMFNKPGSDGLHPNAQGDLLMAGHLAHAMGIPGRTAGLPRKAMPAAEKKPRQLAKGDSISLQWKEKPAADGFSVEFTPRVGDGAKGGWKTGAQNALSVTAGNESLSGTLAIDEARISWDGKALYSADMSANTKPVRLVYTAGAADKGIPGGFYVWLGDMLIGEALPPAARADSGIAAGIKATVGGLATLPEAAAPTK
ncbi:MAG: GDSL-type esterase/lipase family protein [Akkermansia sp.]|nr:GDSL-type esterase/lipase family protein [Akkermansia sp.]